MIRIKPESWHYRMWKSHFRGKCIPTRVGICQHCWTIVRVAFGWVGSVLSGICFSLVCLALVSVLF